MVDPLEKKLGDLVLDLQSRRDELRRELDKVNAQLEVISGLVGTGSSQSKARAHNPERIVRMASERPTASSSKSAPKKKRRGRPPKSTSTAKAASTNKTSKRMGKSGKTLKDELVSIAKSHGGSLKVSEASQQLVKSGRYSDAAQASANIHAAIQYYKANFIRDPQSRGVYKVKA